MKMRPQITKKFPYVQLTKVAELESWRKELFRPIYYTHKWWARRLGSVFRTIIGSSLFKEYNLETFYQTHLTEDRVILDPFMGSGTTIGEALKFGAKVIGSDINPVSYFMVSSTFSNVKLNSLNNEFKRLEKSAKEKISYFYKTLDPQSRKEVDALYYFWVAVLPCPHCAKDVDLFSSYIFSKNAYPKKKPISKAFCPSCKNVTSVNYLENVHICEHCNYSFNAHEGNASSTTVSCSSCNKEFSIRKRLAELKTPFGYRMYALTYLTEDGKKKYKAIEKFDLDRFEEAQKFLSEIDQPLTPKTKIKPGYNTDQILNYNFEFWHQLFNQRQLYCLHLLLEEISHIENSVIRDVFLMLFSGTLEFNNMFCSFKGEGTGAIRHMFSHHILKAEKMPLEGNLWGTPYSSGSFSTLFKSRILKAFEYIEKPFEVAVDKTDNKSQSNKVYLGESIKIKPAKNYQDLVANNKNLLLFCRDSSELPIPQKSVDFIITDPPFFDFINYSELADFFYAWIRILNRNRDSFRAESTRNEREVQGQDKDHFINNLSSVLAECGRVLKDDGLLVFTFHHSQLEGWSHVAQAITNADFKVIKTYPVKSEMAVSRTKYTNKNPINFDAIIVCSKGSSSDNTDANLISNLKADIAETVKDYLDMNQLIENGDLRVVTYMKFLERTHGNPALFEKYGNEVTQLLYQK